MTHLKRPWCWEGLKVGGEGDDRGWDGWMASPTQWTWIWVNSGSWWWTGKPGVLRSIGSQRVWHDWATDLNWTRLQWPVTMNIIFFFFFFFAHTSRIGWVILLKWSKLSWFWVGSLTHQQSAGGSDGVWLVEDVCCCHGWSLLPMFSQPPTGLHLFSWPRWCSERVTVHTNFGGLAQKYPVVKFITCY